MNADARDRIMAIIEKPSEDDLRSRCPKEFEAMVVEDLRSFCPGIELDFRIANGWDRQIGGHFTCVQDKSPGIQYRGDFSGENADRFAMETWKFNKYPTRYTFLRELLDLDLGGWNLGIIMNIRDHSWTTFTWRPAPTPLDARGPLYTEVEA